jgi:hypothetical protein
LTAFFWPETNDIGSPPLISSLGADGKRAAESRWGQPTNCTTDEEAQRPIAPQRHRDAEKTKANSKSKPEGAEAAEIAEEHILEDTGRFCFPFN